MFGSLFRTIKESVVSVGNTDDPDAPFKWAQRCGVRRDPKVFAWVDLHPLSVGGGEPYDGVNGPYGFTTSDAELIDSFIRAARSQGEDVAGWIVESNDGDEWQRCDGAWDKNW